MNRFQQKLEKQLKNHSQERKNAMNFKKLSLLLLPVLLVAVMLGFSSGQARAAEPCYFVHPDMTFSASTCSDIVFTWGWAAMTKGQINVFLKAVQDTITVRDGEGNVLQVFTPAQVAQTWGKPYPIDPAELGLKCPMPQAWVTDSTVSLGSFFPGAYTLTLDRYFIHPFNDGYNACWYEGFKIPVSLYREGGSFTAGFTVEP